MGIEIERKYLVNLKKWGELYKVTGKNYQQGYISTDPKKNVRVRLTDENGFITIKGRSVGASRSEFEYIIPKIDAEELLNNFCSSKIIKVRYKINYSDKLWEIDEFLGENEGLIIAEIELLSETEIFELPPWIEQEVTDDKRYYNSYISEHPYKNWQ